MSKPLPPRPEQSGSQKPAPPQPKAEKPRAPRKASPWPWGAWRRSFLSVLIAFHVVAVFSAPWFIQMQDIFEPALPPGRAPRDAQGRVIPMEQLDPRQYPPLRPVLPEALASYRSRFPLIWHYANLLYINNGYDFFSPDPTFNTIIRYEVYDAAGQSIIKGELPNKREQWPRLLYHRYMMLADQSSDPRNVRLGWTDKIGQALLAEYDGATVHMETVRHHLLTPEEVLAGRRLNEDSTYERGINVVDVRRSEPPRGSASASPGPTEPAVTIPGGGR